MHIEDYWTDKIIYEVEVWIDNNGEHVKVSDFFYFHASTSVADIQCSLRKNIPTLVKIERITELYYAFQEKHNIQP